MRRKTVEGMEEGGTDGASLEHAWTLSREPVH